MNETLEQMARALFKSWFIDFEPVRAKMEGRWKKGQSLPGLPAHLYDLFPDRLVRTEFGEIPEGWHQKKLENIIDFKKGKKPSIVYQKPRAESLPVILIESFDRDPNIYSDPEAMVLADYDDVLMVMDGASSGRVETGQRGIVGSTIAKVILNDYNLSKQFIYYFLKFIEPISRKHLTGTSIPHSDKRWILSQILYLPDDKILLKEFENIAITFRTKINLNNKECWNLVLMRDSLLPKLINGQIRVKDAEIFLKEGGL
jgi:type I restriction enzyme S subunit